MILTTILDALTHGPAPIYIVTEFRLKYTISYPVFGTKVTDLFLKDCQESCGFLGFHISEVPWIPIEEPPAAYRRAASCDAR